MHLFLYDFTCDFNNTCVSQSFNSGIKIKKKNNNNKLFGQTVVFQVQKDAKVPTIKVS